MKGRAAVLMLLLDLPGGMPGAMEGGEVFAG
jgi:hypothetical protein